MRNLREHPITNAEVVRCLLDLHHQLVRAAPTSEPILGDMRPLLIAEAVRIVQAAPDEGNSR